MARLDVERKRKTGWPWVAGGVLLLIVLWGVTALVNNESQAAPEAAAPLPQDRHIPAALPAPPNADPVDTGTDPARGVEEVAPLGEEDIGQTVRLSGEVVATGNDAFWIHAGREVVRVESDRRVHRGDTVSVAGTLRPADPGRTDRILDVLERHPAAAEWSVIRAIQLVEEGMPEAGPAAARPSRPEA